MPYLYILKSFRNDRYYIGSTIDVERRLEEHNSGKSPYTKFTRPFTLVFKHEYSSLSEARRVESKLKRYKSRHIIELIVKDQMIRIRD